MLKSEMTLFKSLEDLHSVQMQQHTDMMTPKVLRRNPATPE